MRFGLERQAAGADVRWVDLANWTSIPRLRAAIRDSAADLVLFDDVESFGHQAGPFLAEVVGESNVFLAVSARASRYEALQLESYLAETPFVQVTIPYLEDRDIELLLETLARAQRLGRLRGMTPEEQIDAFRGQAGRQLLVAMIQATSGERFEEKIGRECRDLPRETQLLYAIAALPTAYNQFFTRQELLLASGDSSNENANRLQGLVNQHVLIATGNQLKVRHRLIAEKVVDYFRTEGQLGEAVRGVMFALASGIDRAHYPRGREVSLLKRLMNHEWLIRNLLGNRVSIRGCYDSIEDQLAWDYHYWLQRGSFEVEVGDLALAQNLLEQARSLAAEDYKVQTEWAYMTIKRAAQTPGSSQASERVAEAFAELEDAVSRRGHIDSYPAHVMGSQGLSWVRQAPLTPDEKLRVLTRLRGVVDSALEHHPQAPDLNQLARDLTEEYLLVGAVPTDR